MMVETDFDFREQIWRGLQDIARKYGAESIMEVWGGILDRLGEKGLPSKAPDMGNVDAGGFVNVIPSSTYGPCTPELLVLCFDKDNLHERLREMLYHAGILCNHRLVFFCTTKWDPYVFEFHERAVEALRQRGATIVFVMIGPKGAQEMPV